MNAKNYEELGFAKVDHHRIKRQGMPEVIYCAGKTPSQVAKIAQSIAKSGHNILATRADKKQFQAVKKALKKAKYFEEARIIVLENRKSKIENRTQEISIVSASTSDLPISEEAAITAEFLGHKVERFYDVGVSGIHRLMNNIEAIKKAQVIIVVAGMEGALPSVIGGLVDKPIIAVPTSVGYGANFEGLSALLTMMNSCAPGIAVVNINNGFGAAAMAHTIINSTKTEYEKDTILQIETNIDDMNPKLWNETITQLMETGALDAYITPIRMKKKRQGYNLVVLCQPEQKQRVLDAIFEQTTTFGVRIQEIKREKLARKFKLVKTKYGQAKVKLGLKGKKVITVAPEYKDYKKLAKKHLIPIEKAYSEVLKCI